MAESHRDTAEEEVSSRDGIMGSKLPGRAEVEPRVECFWLQIRLRKWTLWCLWSGDWRVCGKTFSSMVHLKKDYVSSCKMLF